MTLSATLFISEAPQARVVTLADGSSHEMHFKQLPASEFRRFFLAMQSADEAAQGQAMAKLIAASICEPDGKPALTVKQAMLLTPAAEKAIGDAVLSVNGLGGREDPGDAPGKT